MAENMEVVRYTEYTREGPLGKVTVQVPEGEDLPVQVIMDFGKQLVLKIEEFNFATLAVGDALEAAGWVPLK